MHVHIKMAVARPAVVCYTKNAENTDLKYPTEGGGCVAKADSSLKQRVYDQIKRCIIQCEYAPGETMHEELICQQFNVSRTPVRDALSRLEQERLITILPKKGFKINRVSIRLVNELFEARLRIEPYIVETYGSRLGDEHYAECIRQFTRPCSDFTSQELYAMDDGFHSMFVQASDNRYLKMMYAITADQAARFRVLTAEQNRLEESRIEHLGIAGCCMKRDWREAAELSREHIRLARNAIIDFVMDNKLTSSNIFEGIKAEEDDMTQDGSPSAS